MFIIECLPLTKSIGRDALSYFSSKEFEPGSLIKVPLRGRNVHALVIACKQASQNKAELKSADFSLRRVQALAATPFLHSSFLEGIRAAADHFAVSIGSILYHLLPTVILENPKLLNHIKNETRAILPDNLKSRVEAMQTDYEERYSHYKAVIREEFAKKRSVFLCLPQGEDIKRAREKLERGIEPYVTIFHSGLKRKQVYDQWKIAMQTEHPVVVIATAGWLFLPRNDFGIIILDQENKSGWKTMSRPYIDWRTVIEYIARKTGIRTVIGDSFLRTETLWRYKQGEIEEFESIKWRLPSGASTQVVDSKAQMKEKDFEVISPQLVRLIQETIDRSGHIFIYAARKGLAPSTVCRDCGELVTCDNCTSPMILYKRKGGNVFRCHQCGAMRDAAELCRTCKSWKLVALGSGVDRVHDEIHARFPRAHIFEIHKDVTPTSVRATTVSESFYNTRGSILIGTEMALSYLHKKVTHTAISAFDTLFSIPDFRIREKIFRLILEVRNVAKESFLLQTRNLRDPVIEMATAGNLIDYYKMEIEERQEFMYPPFSIFIKITARGTKAVASKAAEELSRVFANWRPAIFPSLHEKRGEQASINAVIKIPRSEWPHKSLELLATLRSLNPQFEIKVDPDNLL